ncbi:single-stranded DNA-binding protein 3-like [Penaeus monodon]|uniref:single-stranded DNA-binding protein 3-like n=1 Tax=Penaeus monodon TaxID=6687 RepID=UPI0018A78AEA|nr:single-stranded DNA-binding protein 3-like [Penaeus monodon]
MVGGTRVGFSSAADPYRRSFSPIQGGVLGKVSPQRFSGPKFTRIMRYPGKPASTGGPGSAHPPLRMAAQRVQPGFSQSDSSEGLAVGPPREGGIGCVGLYPGPADVGFRVPGREVGSRDRDPRSPRCRGRSGGRAFLQPFGVRMSNQQCAVKETRVPKSFKHLAGA